MQKVIVARHKHYITFLTQLLPVIQFSQSCLVLNASANYCILGELMKIHAVRPGLHVKDYCRYCNNVWRTSFHGNRFLQNVPKLICFYNIQANTFILQPCHWRNIFCHLQASRHWTLLCIIYQACRIWSNWLKLADFVSMKYMYILIPLNTTNKMRLI